MMIRRVVLACLAWFVISAGAIAPYSAQSAAPNVVLVTLDGARSEEIFGGLDAAVYASTLARDARLEDQATYQRFWADTPNARRERLMPFFWRTLMTQHGSIAGNPDLGSRVRLSNRHWFSYPGYAELLIGVAHDESIASNDPVRNPYPTVLEFLRARFSLAPEQVAVFGSWSVLNAIAESKAGAITVNAGFETYEHPDPAIRALSEMQTQTPTPWDSVRHDYYTFRFAMAHLATYKPRVLYLALGETDDWAHDGRYDRVLESLSRTDGYLETLWTWLQAQPEYRGTTSLLVTVDHGRGVGPEAWRSHGARYPEAERVWMAFASPRMTRRGEWRDHPALTSAQAAATLVEWMGADWKAFDPHAAPPVREGE
jgi:hypothetical protein